MANPRKAQVKIVVVGVVVALVVVGAALFTVPPLRGMLGFSGDEKSANGKAEKPPAAEVIRDANNKPGLRLTKLAVEGLGIVPVAAETARQARALPPQVGTINFDNETLFAIPSRFPGEIAEIGEIDDDDAPPDAKDTSAKHQNEKRRPLRYGDRVQQGDLLAVVHSTALGAAKAALVDTVCSLKLSTETLERHYKLYAEGSIALATLRQSERQKEADSNTLLTAERTLRIMKLDEEEVKKVKDEAAKIADLANAGKIKRDAKEEAEMWARVEVRVPVFDKATKDKIKELAAKADNLDPKEKDKLLQQMDILLKHKDKMKELGDKADPLLKELEALLKHKELTIVEKNTNLYAMVDPINTNTALFKVADLTRMQIWVHPPEEYLPDFRKMLVPNAGDPTWNIEVQAFPEDKLPPMKFTQIAPSLEPNQHTPMLMGYLVNPESKKYVVGQFVTATIMVRSEANTVEIPTKALNEVNGEALVFVQPDKAKNEFFLRRVAVVHRFKDVTLVRTKLTAAEDKQNVLDAARKTSKGPMEPLLADEMVVTQGVVELTAALEDLLTKEGTDNKKK
jgi:multidrug efflux pump subunit AcrA (membrane-fusion protein)